MRVVTLITPEGGYGHGARPEADGFTSLVLPRLATSVGGLPWHAVWPVIDDRLRMPGCVYAEVHPEPLTWLEGKRPEA